MNAVQLGKTYSTAELLPHGPSMMLLDRLVTYRQDFARFETDIRPDAQFHDGRDGVPAWVGVEYMAQATCAYVGIERLQAGKKVQVNLLLGTRSYECSRPVFATGATLTIDAELLFRAPDGVNAFACSIGQNGDAIAKAELKVYGPDDIEPYLNGLAKELP
jgi:predicted hotdog family 3-hydroxylacyl-ACP dehydratase